MTKHLGILISPKGEEFYDAYGPMTKLRDRATRFDDAVVATKAADNRYGRHSDAFWNSERESRDRRNVEYRGWTSRTEEVSDDDMERQGHFITDYAREGSADDKRYATLDEHGQTGWTRDLGECGLWASRSEALSHIQSLPKTAGRGYSIESY